MNMKYNLLKILFSLLLSSSILIGQKNKNFIKNCDTTESCYWLNTSTFYNMPKMKIGKYYNHALNIKIPKDTIISINGSIKHVNIKDIKIIKVNNIPKGMLYSHSIMKSEKASYILFHLQVYGRATNTSALPINVKLKVSLLTDKLEEIEGNYTINNISIKEDNKILKMETYDKSIGLKSLRSYPNLMSSHAEISFWSDKLQVVIFEVKDAIGNLRYKRTFTAKVGNNKFSFSKENLPNGLYLYSVKSEGQFLAKRLIIK